MEKIGIAAFTENGKALAEKLEKLLEPEFQVCKYEKDLKQWCAKCFEQSKALVFIGACGIAVRTIAPFLKSKTVDPAVLVIDEKGQFVISLISGHIGGANEFAIQVAEKIGAVPVITTASDVNGKIAVDVFAKKNGLAIGSMKDAKAMASAILRGCKVGVYCTGEIQDTLPKELFPAGQEKADALIWISEVKPDKKQAEEYLKKEDGPVLHLIPKIVTIGIGCRKNKTYEKIKDTVDTVLEQAGISVMAVQAAASIELKKDEAGIKRFCEELKIPFLTYTAEELAQVQGEFEHSSFVEKTTGVDNVCERSALLAAGKGGKIIRKKYAKEGVTVALAVREWRICFGK